MRWALFFALLLLGRISFAQTDTITAPEIPSATNAVTNPKPAPPPKLSRTAMTAVELQKAVDQLTQSNRDLLDLLKKQQAVLEDMQYDRRLQSRRLESLEEELTEARLQNTQLQNKVANLEADAAVRPIIRTEAPTTTGNGALATSTNSPPDQAAPAPVAPTPPSTYLPPPDTEGAPGTQSWHRLFTLKGTDSRQTDLFHIEGKTWRVVWHNQDPEGKSFKGTSGLFIDAFPKDDTIPQHACAKVGTGGDSTELEGPGNYYLKITASGGSWELAVEDFSIN